MERYIEQLIDDIHLATWNISPLPKITKLSETDPDNEQAMEDISFAEKNLYGKNTWMSKITGFLVIPRFAKVPHQ